MINIKAIATATDGSVKRMAITYDAINDEGKVTSSNAKLNRVVIDQAALKEHGSYGRNRSAADHHSKCSLPDCKRLRFVPVL